MNKDQTLTTRDDADFADLAAEYGELGARLRSPLSKVSLDDFLRQLRGLKLTIQLEGMAPFAGDWGLAGRIRGALGAVLTESASAQSLAGEPCRWQPPCTFDALFRKPGRMTPGTDFPSPWVIGVDIRRGDMTVSLSLFGMACEWAPAAADCLVKALQQVDWAGHDKRFVPKLNIVNRRLRPLHLSEERFNTGNDIQALELEMYSPLVSSAKGAKRDPAAAFTTLGFRLEGLARWHELSLDTGWAEMTRKLRSLDWQWANRHDAPWQRGSKRQDRHIPMCGVLGQLNVSGEASVLCELYPLFLAGGLVHVGADIAFGCGRYHVRAISAAAS